MCGPVTSTDLAMYCLHFWPTASSMMPSPSLEALVISNADIIGPRKCQQSPTPPSDDALRTTAFSFYIICGPFAQKPRLAEASNGDVVAKREDSR